MKRTLFTCAACAILIQALTLSAAVARVDLKKFGVRPIGDWQVDPAETAELQNDFDQALAPANSIRPNPDSSAQRRAIDARACPL
jgi:hypothetical protein